MTRSVFLILAWFRIWKLQKVLAAATLAAAITTEIVATLTGVPETVAVRQAKCSLAA